jgi:hypothetical protein
MKTTKKAACCILCGSARPDLEAVYFPRRPAEYGNSKAVRYRICSRHHHEVGWMARVELALKNILTPDRN